MNIIYLSVCLSAVPGHSWSLWHLSLLEVGWQGALQLLHGQEYANRPVASVLFTIFYSLNISSYMFAYILILKIYRDMSLQYILHHMGLKIYLLSPHARRQTSLSLTASSSSPPAAAGPGAPAPSSRWASSSRPPRAPASPQAGPPCFLSEASLAWRAVVPWAAGRHQPQDDIALRKQ